MLTFAQFLLGNKVLVNVSLVNRRQIVNILMSLEHNSLDIIYLPGQKTGGVPPFERVFQFA